MSGWVKLYRKLLKSDLFTNPSLCHCWTYCLLKASWQETKVMVGYIPVILEPGQFIFGRKKASKETGLSVQTVRSCMAILNKDSDDRHINITSHPTKQFSIVTVCNWEHYQGDDENSNQPPTRVNGQDIGSTQLSLKNQPKANHPSNQPSLLITHDNREGYMETTTSSNHPSNQPSTSLQPASNQPPTTYKKGKKIKKIKNTYSQAFLRWWKIYPRKQGKYKAFECWQKDGLEDRVDDLVKILDVFKRSKAWRADGGKWIPWAQTFLNQHRYDDVDTEEQSPVNPQISRLTKDILKQEKQDERLVARKRFAKLSKDEQEPWRKKAIEVLSKLPYKSSEKMIDRYAAEYWYSQKGNV